MKKLFKPLNDWYDSLREPWRFLLLVAMVLAWTVGMWCGPHRPIVIGIAILVLFFQTCWALSRE